MDSVNTNTDIQNKSSSFGFKFNSSLGNMLNNGGTINSMFANLLSQTQDQDPPSNATPSNIQQSSPPQPADNNTAAASNTNNANTANNANASNNTNASNSTKSNKSNLSVTGNSSRPHTKRKDASKDSDDNNSNTVTNTDPAQSPPPANNQVATNAAVTGPANNGNPQPASNQDDGDADSDLTVADTPDPTSDAVSNTISASNSVAAGAATPGTPPPVIDPAVNTTNAGPVITADLLANIGPAPVTVTPTSPGNSTPVANAPVTNPDPAPSIDPTTDITALLNAAIAANTDPTTTSAVAAPAAAATLVDPTAASNNTSASTNTDPTAFVATTGTPASELLMLLMQLERLAVNQAAGTTPPTNTDPMVASNGQISTTAAAGTDAQNKIDLKSLLTAIAKLDSSTSANTSATDQNSAPVLSDAANLSSLSATAPALPQNPAPATTGTAADTTNKLISADFLNLFSLPGTNPNAPATLPAFNPGVASNTLLSGDGGSSLDAETQGQNNTGARAGTTSLPPDINSLLPNAAPTQGANPYDFASQLSAMRATQGGTAGLPTPVEQVVLQLSRGLSKDGSSQMTIQLRPAELGRVDVKLNISSDGKVQGTVTADNPATLSLLLKDVRGLERALQEAGLRADSGSLQFGLRGDGQPGNGSGQTAGNQSGFDDAGTLSNAATMLPAFANPVETYYLTPGGVNMRV